MTAPADLAARIARAREAVVEETTCSHCSAPLRPNRCTLCNHHSPRLPRTALPALLDVAEAAGEMRRCCMDTRAMSCADFDHAFAALDAALAKLKEVLDV